ncbi:MAG: tetratricopeptide repeat protein [Acidobacteria bacterium]|nr:tetratricopeptide repeat protein [Acidobacteriota bacterium]
MKPAADWDRVTELLEQALEQPAEGRQAFLDHNEPDPAIRAQVLKLITTWDKDPHFLDLNLNVPAKAGPWVIGREIAKGGMGRVFEAVHEDPSLSRRVALKIIGTERFTPNLLESFLQERAILARLEHPAIGRLYDTGTTPQGLPYFAMEFVDGITLDKWLAKRNPGPRARVQLILAIAEAVGYAHQNFVAHGDLKPTNILVTPNDEPRILDFGIGRLLNTSDAGHLPMLTPSHASPEQLAGRAITASSDIYQLGLLLRDSMQARDRELEAIVERCLKPNPSDRYPNVGMIVADLRAWLDQRPVSVLAPTLAYRASKWIRRSPFGAALVLALIAGAAGTSWQAYRAERQRLENIRQFEETRRFTRNLLAGIDNVPAAAQAAIVKNTVAMLEGLTIPKQQNPQLLLEAANAWGLLGNIQGLPSSKNLGDTKGALRSFEKAIALAERARPDLPRESIEMLADLLGRTAILEHHVNQLDRVAELKNQLQSAILALEAFGNSISLANAYTGLAIVEATTNRRAAIPLYEKAIDTYSQVGKGTTQQRALALKRLGAILLVENRLDEGAKRYQEALAIERSIQASPMNISFTLSDLALVNRRRKSYPAAIALYREALALRESAHSLDPSDNHASTSLASILSRLAATLAEAGQPEEAVAMQRRVLSLQQKLSQSQPDTASVQHTLAWSYLNLANLLGQLKPPPPPAEAKELRRQAASLSSRFPLAELTAELKKQGISTP